MTWNHRVVRRASVVFGKPVEVLGIHEVFYGPDGGISWTTEPVAAEGDTLDELRETLERMLKALDQPIIDGTK
jgi:hypothetical protein